MGAHILTARWAYLGLEEKEESGPPTLHAPQSLSLRKTHDAVSGSTGGRARLKNNPLPVLGSPRSCAARAMPLCTPISPRRPLQQVVAGILPSKIQMHFQTLTLSRHTSDTKMQVTQMRPKDLRLRCGINCHITMRSVTIPWNQVRPRRASQDAETPVDFTGPSSKRTS